MPFCDLDDHDDSRNTLHFSQEVMFMDLCVMQHKSCMRENTVFWLYVCHLRA